jgi:hypothetical protein
MYSSFTHIHTLQFHDSEVKHFDSVVEQSKYKFLISYALRNTLTGTTHNKSYRLYITETLR